MVLITAGNREKRKVEEVKNENYKDGHADLGWVSSHHLSKCSPKTIVGGSGGVADLSK